LTLTRSKVKVTVTGLLNFRQLAKPCMLAAMTAAPLRGFLVVEYVPTYVMYWCCWQQYMYDASAPCGLWGVMGPWFICWFRCCVYHLPVYIVCFPLIPFPYHFFLTYLLPYLSSPLRIDPLFFQARGHKMWRNLFFSIFGLFYVCVSDARFFLFC